MAGFENDVVYAKNADFSQSDNQAPVEANGLATNGQLWIGTTAANAGGTHVNVGTLTSPDASVTIGYSSPNITLTASGGSASPDIFSVYLAANTANQTGDGTTVTVPFDTVVTDSAGGFNIGTYTYTFPRTKFYQITTNIFTYNSIAAHDYVVVDFLVNGVTVYKLFEFNLGVVQTPGQQFVVSGSSMINATAGDTLVATVRVIGSTKTVGLAGTYCKLSGFSVN